MQELLELTTKIHILSIIFTFILSIYIIFIFFKLKDYKTLTRKYERYILIYYFFISSIFFTGLILFTLLKFKFSVKIVLMIIGLIHMIVTSVKLYIKFKSSNLKDTDSQNIFIKYTKKKFIIDLIVLTIVGIMSYAIHF